MKIENEEGSITVSTWQRDDVAYRARIVEEQNQTTWQPDHSPATA